MVLLVLPVFLIVTLVQQLLVQLVQELWLEMVLNVMLFRLLQIVNLDNSLMLLPLLKSVLPVLPIV